MVVIRDEKRIARLGRLAQIFSFAGLGVLIAGLLLIFITDNANVFIYQMVALVIGFILSQFGLHFAHRYLRRPRMDQALDKAAGKFARKDGRLYHYMLPANHVLLLPTSVIVLVAKFQTGRISASGDVWQQKGLGLRGMMGREGLGNPSREADEAVARLKAFIDGAAPLAAEVPVIPIIVFTAQNVDSLEVKESRIPAVHAAKLSGALRQSTINLKPMPAEAYQALRAAFDARSSHVLEQSVAETAEQD